ncbi:Uncharacterized protein Tcan_18974 [Toxocara canis]|uniref:Ubiquitin-like domain-containing protein n=1 Tax=Toxocara canis TaxID=6265 RepID=A0A0B2V781_TOXCA|nr:Uncharacterized protein Tcan_18974 [Toxocara canis]
MKLRRVFGRRILEYLLYLRTVTLTFWASAEEELYLQTSRTCPECRAKTSSHSIVKQLYFHTDDPTQAGDASQLLSEEALASRLEKVEAELVSERKFHSKTQDALLAAQKAKNKADALYESEKKKCQSMMSRLEKMQHVEMLLQDQQHLQSQIEKYKSRLRASTFYDILSASSEDGSLAKIDEYLKDSGDPDASKFLVLIRRQLNETKKKHLLTLEQLNRSQRINCDLKVKLNKHKNLNVALKEELEALRGDKALTPRNPKLKNVICYSPERRASLGFELDQSDEFSSSLIGSAFKARNRPTHRAHIVSARGADADSLIFDHGESSSSRINDDALNAKELECCSHSGDLSEVNVPEIIMQRVLMESTKKKRSNGMGGVIQRLPQSTASLHSKRHAPYKKPQEFKKSRSKYSGGRMAPAANKAGAVFKANAGVGICIARFCFLSSKMMSELVEGVGEEVLWVLLAVLVIAIVSLAWISTGIPPVEYYVWLVQMQIYPNRRVVQVLHMDHEDAGVLEHQLVQRGNAEQAVESAIRTSNEGTEMSSAEASSARTNVVVETPSAIANRNSAESRWPSRGVSGVARHWEVQLTPSSDGTQQAATSTLPSADQLQQTLRRRTLVDDTLALIQFIGNADRQARRLLLSRVPVPLQQPEEVTSAVVPDLNMIASRVEVERREGESVASADTDQHTDLPGTAEPNTASNLAESASSATEALLQGKQSTEAQELNTECGGSTDQQDSSSIKLKFLDDTQIIASTALDATVGQFKRRYFWESMVAGKVVRLIYRGQLLRDDSRSLSSYGLHDQCVLHCHVSSTPYAQPTSSPPLSPPANTSAANALGSTLLQSATAAAIAAIAGSQSVSVSTAAQFTRRVPQTYRGRPIEDNPNDPILLRTRNAILRCFRSVYNSLLGPDPHLGIESEVDTVEAAAEAAARGWNRQDQPLIGGRLGQYLHLLFIVKFVMLWAFVFFYPQYTDRFSLLLLTFLSLFFATIMLSNRRADVPLPTNS